MGFHYQNLSKLLSYEKGCSEKVFTYGLTRPSNYTSAIVEDIFWQPYGGRELAKDACEIIEEKFLKLYFSLYADSTVKKIWISEYFSYTNFLGAPMCDVELIEGQPLTGRLITIIHKEEGKSANTLILGSMGQCYRVRIPLHIRAFWPGSIVKIIKQKGQVHLTHYKSAHPMYARLNEEVYGKEPAKA